ncbi:SAM hydrolase/SAM-dependent halogenase family protein [Thermoleophilum album]|uniref:SAM-dependent chlorinase/fluorinase n=1 Tax=Thermoleophilum album TaxID=29539 RepID=A0A1H6FNF3_THEAL|nr:SAM-dependent chlorinase/fluorinase [Thermoleophilum album]SEH11294.1 hypothetical protein SAMN02745716_0721 [Thermoleophilum album]
MNQQSTGGGQAHQGHPIVTLLTDYGLVDEYVGVVHGVIAGICPQARVLDLTHGIERHDIRRGALVLRAALPFCPVGVHLAIVDPEVGAARRAIAVRTSTGRLLVGPDNGLLSLAWQQQGGVVEAVEITHSPLRLEPVSATFHGRDIFAPVAAHLAAGAPLAETGTPLAPEELVELEMPAAEVRSPGVIAARVLTFDRFGNAILSASHEDATAAGLRLGRPARLTLGERSWTLLFVRTFADVAPGEPLLYEDSWRMLALAVNRGDARREFGLEVDAEVVIEQTEAVAQPADGPGSGAPMGGPGA